MGTPAITTADAMHLLIIDLKRDAEKARADANHAAAMHLGSWSKHDTRARTLMECARRIEEQLHKYYV